MQRAGWKLGGDSKAIWIEKGGKQFRFDIVIPTASGAIFAMYIKRKKTREVAQMGTKPIEMNIQKAHDMLGHSNKEEDSEANPIVDRFDFRRTESCRLLIGKRITVDGFDHLRNSNPHLSNGEFVVAIRTQRRHQTLARKGIRVSLVV